MKRITILCAVLLAGCSSFKLGSVMYCASGDACSLNAVPVLRPAPVKAAASGVGV